MIKILNTEQIRKADKETIDREPISSVDLMERAATKCVAWFKERFDTDRPVFVFAGIGNNGGDALVMSRLLLDAGYQVESFVVRFSEKFSEELQVNLDRLKAKGHEVTYILEEEQFPSISSNSVIIDGLFGSGLNRPAEGLAQLCIEQVNSSIADVVSIDLPSGLFADEKTPEKAEVIIASHTLSFQTPKLAFFIPENEEYVGEWHILDIGLNQDYLTAVRPLFNYVDSIESYSAFFDRSKHDHKGNFGHGLLIAGSYGKMGAAILAARAALRAGLGKLTVHVPHSANGIMQVAVPEAMSSVDDYDEFIGELPSLDAYSHFAIGPGIGLAKKTRRFLKSLLSYAKRPLILDADALNLIAKYPELMDLIPANSILTPHVGEFERLFGSSKHVHKRLEVLREQAVKRKCVIVLKGANTAIASPQGEIYFNSTGNPGMATAGSGDVLTGVMLAFIAQIPDPVIAAVCAVYVHGYAGDLAAENKGLHGMIAGDIVDELGVAIQQIMQAE
jgi:NAD(P)H-hydrate epimerase